MIEGGLFLDLSKNQTRRLIRVAVSVMEWSGWFGSSSVCAERGELKNSRSGVEGSGQDCDVNFGRTSVVKVRFGYEAQRSRINLGETEEGSADVPKKPFRRDSKQRAAVQSVQSASQSEVAGEIFSQRPARNADLSAATRRHGKEEGQNCSPGPIACR